MTEVAVAERRFRAMGTQVHVVVTTAHDNGEDLLDFAQVRIDDLERRWSRFLGDSELCALNASAGTGPYAVSAITFDLIARAVDAWRDTDGVFDPTVLQSLVAAGYDRSFDSMLVLASDSPASGPSGRQNGSSRGGARRGAPGCGGIVLDHAALTVALPAGVSIDLGGIGKGCAVDLVSGELRGRARGACVNLGGDLRVWGTSPLGDDSWGVAVEHDERDSDGDNRAVVGLRDGAMATSTVTKRRWQADDGSEQHHLIDPRTGVPSSSSLRTVTTIAADAVTAEIHAKTILINGGVTASEAGGPALLIARDGAELMVNGFDAYRW